MAACDLREEEAEVLKSIFSEDELTISGDYNLEYKVVEHGTTSFVIQIQWPPGYPNVMPCISMDCFYNQHVPQDVKEKIVAELISVAKDQLGSALTYILIEFIKENRERFVKWFATEKVDKSQLDSISPETSVSRKQEKLPQLSKTQKRKYLGRLGQDGELPRGWNWVSVIKHLQQTGSAS
ncbi:hypothetical protein MN116_005355 [Schistosoma mekongi]|uniref:RWD domain-containing protein n=1 Tax=Schistosoma mekongi TaxID=38744 RepID=A0AAE1ZDR4_SCHME|nr:hypothetical protein MN116_005355 [Schistosoma mekongi]